MAVGTVSVGAGVGLATLVAGLIAMANDEEFQKGTEDLFNKIGEGAEIGWDKTKEGWNAIENWFANTFKTKVESQEPILDANGDQIETDNESIETGQETSEEQSAKEPEQKPVQPPKLNPTGTLLGATNSMNEIKDETNSNIETTLGLDLDSYMSELKNLQKEAWKRDDTAYQRAVKDLRESGINVGLQTGNVQPAGNTMVQNQGITSSLNATASLVEELINNNFKGDENDKDRLIQSISTLIGLAVLMSKK